MNQYSKHTLSTFIRFWFILDLCGSYLILIFFLWIILKWIVNAHIIKTNLSFAKFTFHIYVNITQYYKILCFFFFFKWLSIRSVRLGHGECENGCKWCVRLIYECKTLIFAFTVNYILSMELFHWRAFRWFFYSVTSLCMSDLQDLENNALFTGLTEIYPILQDLKAHYIPSPSLRSYLCVYKCPQ